MGLFAGIICDFRQIDGDERTAAAAVKGDELNVVCLMELILQVCHDLGRGIFIGQQFGAQARHGDSADDCAILIGDNIAAFIGHIGKGIPFRQIEGKVGLFDFGSFSRTARQHDKQQGKDDTSKFVQAHFTTSFQYNALAKWFDLRAFNRLRSCFLKMVTT